MVGVCIIMVVKTKKTTKCPNCNSIDIWRYGTDYYVSEVKKATVKIQKYKCKNCLHQWRSKKNV